ncbi:MAG: hypothetical protein JO303_08185 [Caulobacteraceae bacterium]|nr:hypothetical protein [Caulobacteraceae bacterium]
MNKTLKTAVVGLTAAATLGGATLSASQADAHGWGPGAAIGAGILGVAVGASLAHPAYYAPAPVYYGPPPAYYDPGPVYYGYYGCRSHWRWDPYWGRYVRVERCY